MTRAALVLGWLAATGAAAPAVLPAQLARHVSGGGGAATVRVRTTAGGGAALSGTAVGGEGRLTAGGGRLALDVTYREGSLSADTGSAPARDLVEASVLVGTRPLRGLVVRAGPHLRAYVAPAGTERWVWWEAHARYETGIVGTMVRAHLEGWTAVASDVNAPAGAGGARGGEVGLTLWPARRPVWARLAYAVDRGDYGSGAGRVILERVALTVGVGGR